MNFCIKNDGFCIKKRDFNGNIKEEKIVESEIKVAAKGAFLCVFMRFLCVFMRFLCCFFASKR